MLSHVNGFLKYLIIEKNTSSNTNIKYKSDLLRLSSFLIEEFNIDNPESVTINHLRKYLEKIKGDNCLKSTTISNKIAVIKSFFNFLSQSEIILRNPTSFLRLPRKVKRIPRYLNEIELEKLLSAPNRVKSRRVQKFILRDELVLTLLAYTGIRKSELLNLNWEDINLGNKYITIRNTKNKTDRVIPIHNRVFALLDKYLSQRLPINNPALFVGEGGNRLHSNSLRCLFKRSIKLSGLNNKGYTIHSLRHTFATRLLGKDVSLIKIKNLLGHKSIESTEIYLHTTSKDLADSINLL